MPRASRMRPAQAVTRSPVARMAVGVAAGPGGDVAEGVGVAGEAVAAADEVGDGLGFDLADGAVEAVAAVGLVEQDVGEFVGGGLGLLGGGEVVADGDGALGVVGDAVGVGVAVGHGADGEGVALGPDHLGEAVGDAVGVVAVEEVDRRLGERVAVGLGDVEDVDDLEAAEDAGGFVACVVGVAVCSAVGAGGEDGDALLAASDLSAEGLPGPVSGDVGGVGLLQEDQQQVVERVRAEPAGGVEESLPVLAGGEVLDGGDESVVRLGETVGTGHFHTPCRAGSCQQGGALLAWKPRRTAAVGVKGRPKAEREPELAEARSDP